MVHTKGGRRTGGNLTERDKGRRMKVMYTNIDGALSCRLDLEDYLREMDTEIVCIAETKLKEGISFDVNNKYNVWRRDRRGKEGGGVLVMIKKEIVVDQIELGEGRAEVISVKLQGGRDAPTLIVAYVPPKTRSWNHQEYEEIKDDTIRHLEKVLKERKKVILVGDFNCKEVNWETYETGMGENAWGERFLNLMMENMMTQRVKENTRVRGDDEPSQLDLILTRDVQISEDIQCKCPFGKSDHVIMEFEIEERVDDRDESYKKREIKLQKGRYR